MKERHNRKEYNQKYYVENRQRLLDYSKEYQQKNPDINRNSVRKYRYGINKEEYEALLYIQNNVCAICKGTTPGKALSVDHCHTSNKIRGLLCRKCNTALGMFNDDSELLAYAIRYLDRHTEKHNAVR